MLKKSDSRLHFNLETLKFFDPLCLLSFCPQPMHPVNCIFSASIRAQLKEMCLQSFIHSLISASLRTSIDQNQGKDLFCCPYTLGTIGSSSKRPIMCLPNNIAVSCPLLNSQILQ